MACTYDFFDLATISKNVFSNVTLWKPGNVFLDLDYNESKGTVWYGNIVRDILKVTTNSTDNIVFALHDNKLGYLQLGLEDEDNDTNTINITNIPINERKNASTVLYFHNNQLKNDNIDEIFKHNV